MLNLLLLVYSLQCLTTFLTLGSLHIVVYFVEGVTYASLICVLMMIYMDLSGYMYSCV